jgi:hypothetical protein
LTKEDPRAGKRRGGFAWRLVRLARWGRPDLRERLAALTASCTAIRQRTEPNFLQLASDLRTLHEGAAELSRTTREHVRSVRDVFEQNRLIGGGGLAERALADLQSGLGEAEERLRMLGRTCGAMRRLHGQGEQMQRVASLLEVSGYGFAVESARGTARQLAFSAFVTELRRLAGKVGALGEAIAEQARSAEEEAERLGRTMTANLAELSQLTERADRSVRQTAERVEGVLNASWTALQEAERDTARIATHASDAVYHLQFGDIVRQKLEHVADAFREADPALADHVLSVQAGQLELVGEEIASSRQQLDKAFEGLAEETRRLAGTIGRFGGEGEKGEAGGDPLEELRAALAGIEELERRGGELSAGARATFDRAMETAGQLARYLDEVEEINRQMHLQALNAIVKTALLGEEGRTLEILSIHIQRVFGESNDLVAETVGVIEGLAACAQSGNAAARSEEDTAAVPGHVLDQLAHVQDQFHRTMRAAAAESDRQSAALDQARVSLGFLLQLEEEVGALQREVTAVRPGAQGAGVQAHVLTGRYTIASEREVDRRVRQAAEAPHLEADIPAAAAPENANVDLFCDPPAGTPEPEIDSPPAGTPEPEDLGENVELF